MSVSLLCNTVGEIATALASTPTTDSEYDINDVIAGPRQYMHEVPSSATSHQLEFTCASQAVTHCVVQNADYFKNSVDGANILLQYGGAWTTDSTTAVGSMSLVGPRDQDWVKEISQTSTKFRINMQNTSLNSVFRYGRVFFANKFTFNDEPPEINNQSVLVPESGRNRFEAIRGRALYYCERAFTLVWDNVTTAKFREFKALPLHAPFFIYDSDGDLFAHKLEHVIVTRIRYRRVFGANYRLQIDFKRLKHYRSQ